MVWADIGNGQGIGPPDSTVAPDYGGQGHRVNTCRKLFAVVGAASTMTIAAAAEYPTKLIRLIAPFAPGGSNDLLARTVAQKLTEQLGVSVIVETAPEPEAALALRKCPIGRKQKRNPARVSTEDPTIIHARHFGPTAAT
jgi:hypothetical protein